MSIYVPMWLIWTLAIVIGVPIALIFLVLAVFGAMAAWALKDGVWK